MRCMTCAPAFTLIEIMIVLGLLVLLTSMAWPAMESQIRASELPESADRVRSMLYMTRCQAVLEHRRYRIRFEPNQQQPIIEYEPDPIRRSGEFEPVTSGWAAEAVLLAEVQVHEIRLGRPVWTKPLSITSNPDELEKEQEEEEEEDEGTEAEFGADEHERELFLRSMPLDEDIEVDENRPMIVFEADGSSDWAVLVQARVDPEEELEEEEQQLWVVLDGRTGLAYVREKVTEEQLSDPEFFVEREKLELPDIVDVENLSFEVGDPRGSGESFSMGDTFPGGTMADDTLPGGEMADDILPGAEMDEEGVDDFADDSIGSGLDDSGGDADADEGSGRQDGPEELSDKINEAPDLTEEEKEKVHKTMESIRR